MPLYEYYCKKCKSTVSELKSISKIDEIPACECDEDSEMRRCIFTPGLKFEGKGWYSGGFHNRTSTKS